MCSNANDFVMVYGFEFPKATVEGLLSEYAESFEGYPVMLEKALASLTVNHVAVCELDDGPESYFVRDFFDKTKGEHYDVFSKDCSVYVVSHTLQPIRP